MERTNFGLIVWFSRKFKKKCVFQGTLCNFLPHTHKKSVQFLTKSGFLMIIFYNSGFPNKEKKWKIITNKCSSAAVYWL